VTKKRRYLDVHGMSSAYAKYIYRIALLTSYVHYIVDIILLHVILNYYQDWAKYIIQVYKILSIFAFELQNIFNLSIWNTKYKILLFR